MIKKLLVILSVLLIATPLMAQDTSFDGLSVAELMATPRGRYNEASGSVAFSVWYDGNSAASIGVSENTGYIYLFENGTAVTTIPQMNADGFLGIGNPGGAWVQSTTGGTVQQLVSLINLDTNGDWHAYVGPDATAGTAVWSVANVNSSLIVMSQRTPGRTESAPTGIKSDTSQQDALMVGVRAKAGAANRILQIDASGFSDFPQGSIEVWDDTGQIYGKVYILPTDTTGAGPRTALIGEVSPETITFTAPGIGGDFGSSIVAAIVSDRFVGGELTSHPSYPTTGSIAILYNVFETR